MLQYNKVLVVFFFLFCSLFLCVIFSSKNKHTFDFVVGLSDDIIDTHFCQEESSILGRLRVLDLDQDYPEYLNVNARLEEYLKITIMCTPTCSVIDINKANLDDPMPLDNIGEKRVKSIIVLCKLKEY